MRGDDRRCRIILARIYGTDIWREISAAGSEPTGADAYDCFLWHHITWYLSSIRMGGESDLKRDGGTSAMKRGLIRKMTI